MLVYWTVCFGSAVTKDKHVVRSEEFPYRSPSALPDAKTQHLRRLWPIGSDQSCTRTMFSAAARQFLTCTVLPANLAVFNSARPFSLAVSHNQAEVQTSVSSRIVH